jgi:hypothetical protein
LTSWHKHCSLAALIIIDFWDLQMISMKITFLSSCGRIALAASAFLVISYRAEAGTITASGVDLPSVSSAVALASDGDRVVIPPGTASWNSTLTVTKGITLVGATTISGSADSPTVTNATIIVDEVTRDSGLNAPIIVVNNLASGATFRLTGVTLRVGTGAGATGAYNGAVRLFATPPTAVRIDHCHFDGLKQDFIHVLTTTYGVIDHCVFDGYNPCLAITASNGGPSGVGDEAWASPPYFGSEKFIFVEDNTFNNGRSAQTNNNIDCDSGGRYVARYNFFNNCLPNTHGTESGGRHRGSRAIEVYNNTIKFSYAATAGQLRAGTALIHDNTYSGLINGGGMGLRVYREWASFPFGGNQGWGGASGVNSLDSNDPANPHESGTHTGASGTTGVLTDARKNWTPHQWIGYTLYNNSSTNGGNGPYRRSAYIKDNTSNTLTYVYDTTYSVNLTFNNGETYQINKVLAGLDQVGRGQGSLLTNPVGGTITTSTLWPHQALEPVYSWNNTLNGSNVNLNNYGEPTVREGTEFYNNTAMPGYTPYTYPHPLVTGASASSTPAPPTNLRVTPGS